MAFAAVSTASSGCSWLSGDPDGPLFGDDGGGGAGGGGASTVASGDDAGVCTNVADEVGGVFVTPDGTNGPDCGTEGSPCSTAHGQAGPGAGTAPPGVAGDRYP